MFVSISINFNNTPSHMSKKSEIIDISPESVEKPEECVHEPVKLQPTKKRRAVSTK